MLQLLLRDYKAIEIFHFLFCPCKFLRTCPFPLRSQIYCHNVHAISSLSFNCYKICNYFLFHSLYWQFVFSIYFFPISLITGLSILLIFQEATFTLLIFLYYLSIFSSLDFCFFLIIVFLVLWVTRKYIV